MFTVARVSDQIHFLAGMLGISPAELLNLAREAAEDATLLSVEHLTADHARLLLDTLTIIRWTRTLAQEAAVA